MSMRTTSSAPLKAIATRSKLSNASCKMSRGGRAAYSAAIRGVSPAPKLIFESVAPLPSRLQQWWARRSAGGLEDERIADDDDAAALRLGEDPGADLGLDAAIDFGAVHRRLLGLRVAHRS